MSNFNTFGTLSKPLLITGIILSLSSVISLYILTNKSGTEPPSLMPINNKLKSYNNTINYKELLSGSKGDLALKNTTYFWKFQQSQLFNDTSITFKDSAQHRILLLGDSEVGGFKYPLSRYCNANGHKLVGVVEWNSSTILNFAYADTIEALILKFKPTYIFVLLGLNEVYAKDFSNRLKASYNFKKKFEHLPFAWIGPASWIPEQGISNVFANVAGIENFYFSNRLVLPRASDNRHPSVRGYDVWMDSVAIWMKNRPKWALQFNTPPNGVSSSGFNTVFLNAAKYRGY